MGIYFTQVVDWSLTGLFKTKAPAVYVCSERWSPLLMMSAWGPATPALWPCLLSPASRASKFIMPPRLKQELPACRLRQESSFKLR